MAGASQAVMVWQDQVWGENVCLWRRRGNSLLRLSAQWCPALEVQTWRQAVSCRSWGLSSVWSIDLSVPAGANGSPYTWKPFSCSCSSWRRRVCMLLMIRLWWPSSSTPTCLTSLPRGEKHIQKTLLYVDLLFLTGYPRCGCASFLAT